MKEKCCDEKWSDDGRKSDGKDHKGDWGSHSSADRSDKDVRKVEVKKK
jgi:hypothetical protein